jgi:DNA-binding PadR family transcriptional regulator
VANLGKHGFIEEAGTVREGRQPERTTYQITDRGRAELRDWLAELLSGPEDERGGFVAALAEVGILPPDEVIGLLTARLTTLDKANAAQRADLGQLAERLPRIFLIETEYQLAMRVAQSQWLRGLLAELAEGTISGMDGWRRIHETGEIPPEFEELEEQDRRGWAQAPSEAAHDQET